MKRKEYRVKRFVEDQSDTKVYNWLQQQGSAIEIIYYNEFNLQAAGRLSIRTTILYRIVVDTKL